MAQRLKDLSEQSQLVLQLAACLGPRFELAQLARVFSVAPELMREWLDTALRMGLLQPVGNAPAQLYAFADHSIQQVAQALPSAVKLPERHVRMDTQPHSADAAPTGNRFPLQAQLEECNRRLLQQQQELRQHKADTAAALSGRAEFMAHMGHEIRTPLNAIIGMSHLALKHETDTRQRNYLHQIRQSGQQLLAVLNDMLDFSRVEAGQLQMEIIPFELDTVFETLAGLCAEKARAKGLELIWHIAPGVPRNLIGDPLRLGQMLIHYTRNALRFTTHGEVEIAVSVVTLAQGSVKLRFDVRDTGVGLSAEQMERLYSGTAQTRGARKQGGGLGLALSRRLAGLMDGEVGVHSVPGAGANFWFTARMGLGAAQAKRVLSGDLQHKRVLVVDDNANAAAVLCEQLLSLGCMAHGMVSGQAALNELRRAALANEPYDVLMTDWQMPDMDGLELMQHIQEERLTPAPHMVLVTAYGNDSTGPLAGQPGTFQLLQKPVSQPMLFETLLDLFGVTEAVAPVPEVPAASATLLAPLRGARILLVEDNEIQQQVAREMLESEGLVVTLADNGQQALFQIDQSAHAQRPFDLVLMDMQMPVLDGLSAVRLIRNMPDYGKLPIVAMTAHSRETDRQLCLRCGMNDFVSKPIEPQALWQTLARWIRPREGLGQAAAEPAHNPLAAMQTLRSYLQQDDVRAVDLFQQLQASLRQLLGEERFRRTEALLCSFQLEAALNLLQDAGAFSPH